MTPKEKAIELVHKFCSTTEGYYKSKKNLRNAKQCTLIAVNEILDGYEFDSLDIEHKRIMDNINFWDEVKQEIEKL